MAGLTVWFNYSSIMSEDFSMDDPQFWNQLTPVYCDTTRIAGIFLCIVAFMGIILNGSLVYSFARYKVLRSSPNIHVMFISIVGLFASCTILPLTGTSSIYCRWLYKRIGCQLSACIAFFYGCSSSYLLCVVSFSRCYIIIRPFRANNVTVEKSVAISCVAVIISFIWSILPLIGWNEYVMEGTRTSCCINWYDRRFAFTSFTFFLFFVVYLLPLLVLIGTNIITFVGFKLMQKKIRRGQRTVLNLKRIEIEQRILKSIVIMTVGFAFSWTPYAAALFISAFRGKDYAISPLLTFYCACFAKSSVIWIPLLHISTSTQFKLRFVNLNQFYNRRKAALIGDRIVHTIALVHTTDNAMALRTVRRAPDRTNLSRFKNYLYSS